MGIADIFVNLGRFYTSDDWENIYEYIISEKDDVDALDIIMCLYTINGLIRLFFPALPPLILLAGEYTDGSKHVIIMIPLVISEQEASKCFVNFNIKWLSELPEKLRECFHFEPMFLWRDCKDA